MKHKAEIFQIFRIAVAILLSISVLSQSGFVSITKVSCFSCFDKVGVGEVKSCCASNDVSETGLCFSQEPCCETKKVEQKFFSISTKTESLIPEFHIAAAPFMETPFDLLERIRTPYPYTHSKAPPLGGVAILKFICKYSL